MLVKNCCVKEKATYFIANPIPQAVLTKFVILGNGNNLHEPRVRLKTRGLLEDIGRSPIDELGPATLWPDASIVETRLDLGHFV